MRYYGLQNEVKLYLKRNSDLGGIDLTPQQISSLNNYIFFRKMSSLDCSFLSNNPIILSNLVLWLDGRYLSGASYTGTIWKNLYGPANNANLLNGSKFRNSYVYNDNTNDYIEVPDSSALDFGTGGFTIEYWFRKLANTSGGSFTNIYGPNKWSAGNDPANCEWIINIGDGISGSDNRYYFSVASGSTRYPSSFPADVLTINLWNQVVCIRDGNKLKVYRNGVEKVNATPNGFTSNMAINNVNGYNLRIGTSMLNNYYSMADNAILRIYNKALTATEVLQNFNANKGAFQL